MTKLLRDQTEVIISRVNEIHKQKFEEIDGKLGNHEARIDRLEKKTLETPSAAHSSQDYEGKYRKSLTLRNVPVLLKSGNGKEDIYGTVVKICVALGVDVNIRDISESYRMKLRSETRNSLPSIVVQFNSAFHRDSVWNNYMAHKNIKLSDVFPEMEVESRIYMNPLLPPEVYKIKNAIVRHLISPKIAVQFYYKSGYFVKQFSDSTPVQVKSVEDVMKLVDDWQPHGN
jgi:hypothetical protein